MTRAFPWLSLAALAAALFAVGPGRAAEPGPFALAVRESQLARSYKFKDADSSNKDKFFHAVGGDKAELPTAASYKEMIDNYTKPLAPAQDPNARTPRALYKSAIERLTALADAKPNGAAVPYLRDALIELVEAETLIGNDKLIAALQTRFPGRNQRPADPADLLADAGTDFQIALDALAVLSRHPGMFRDGTAAGKDNPFGLVTKADGTTEALNEMHVTLAAVERAVRARVELAKLQFNRSALGADVQKDRTGAAETFKGAGQDAYLWLATAGALHADGTTYSRNGAPEVRAHLASAERVYGMIRRGENPDGYVKDYIPSKPVIEIYSDAVTAVRRASQEENTARGATRAYDSSIGELRRELQHQRDAYKKALQDLCGAEVLDTGDIAIVQKDGRPTTLGLRIVPAPKANLPHTVEAARRDREKFIEFVRGRITHDLQKQIAEMQTDGRLTKDEAGAEPPLPTLRAGAANAALGQIGVQLLELQAAQLALVAAV